MRIYYSENGARPLCNILFTPEEAKRLGGMGSPVAIRPLQDRRFQIRSSPQGTITIRSDTDGLPMIAFSTVPGLVVPPTGRTELPRDEIEGGYVCRPQEIKVKEIIRRGGLQSRASREKALQPPPVIQPANGGETLKLPQLDAATPQEQPPKPTTPPPTPTPPKPTPPPQPAQATQEQPQLSGSPWVREQLERDRLARERRNTPAPFQRFAPGNWHPGDEVSLKESEPKVEPPKIEPVTDAAPVVEQPQSWEKLLQSAQEMMTASDYEITTADLRAVLELAQMVAKSCNAELFVEAGKLRARVTTLI